jgi:hypothetical protein
VGRADGTPADDLRRERDEAIAYARALEHELGRARGRIKRLERAAWSRTARRRRFAAAGRRLRALWRT